MILKKDKIFLAGHQGLVGSAIFKLLKKRGYKTFEGGKKLLGPKKVFLSFNLHQESMFYL